MAAGPAAAAARQQNNVNGKRTTRLPLTVLKNRRHQAFSNYLSCRFSHVRPASALIRPEDRLINNVNNGLPHRVTTAPTTLSLLFGILIIFHAAADTHPASEPVRRGSFFSLPFRLKSPKHRLPLAHTPYNIRPVGDLRDTGQMNQRRVQDPPTHIIHIRPTI